MSRRDGEVARFRELSQRRPPAAAELLDARVFMQGVTVGRPVKTVEESSAIRDIASASSSSNDMYCSIHSALTTYVSMVALIPSTRALPSTGSPLTSRRNASSSGSTSSPPPLELRNTARLPSGTTSRVCRHVVRQSEKPATAEEYRSGRRLAK